MEYELDAKRNKFKFERMKDRPPIPAELRRSVLVEAGHRCAIQTCQHPEVDLHHIIPWERCREHTYDNLIALCPNCHRRADAGEIDRKSLRLYKARLVASFGISDMNASTGYVNEHKVAWRTEVIREQYGGRSPYEVEIEFPRFVGATEDLHEISAIERAHALEKRSMMRWHRLDEFEGDSNTASEKLSIMTASYEVATCTESLVSIRYSVFHFGAGAAHANHWTDVSNFQLAPLTGLTLNSLFQTKSPYLQTLSQYCINQLAEQKSQGEPSESVRHGAGTDFENFSKFNITGKGLLITFDEYQVDSYAAGASQVEVPKEILRDFVNAKCSVAELWI